MGCFQIIISLRCTSEAKELAYVGILSMTQALLCDLNWTLSTLLTAREIVVQLGGIDPVQERLHSDVDARPVRLSASIPTGHHTIQGEVTVGLTHQRASRVSLERERNRCSQMVDRIILCHSIY